MATVYTPDLQGYNEILDPESLATARALTVDLATLPMSFVRSANTAAVFKDNVKGLAPAPAKDAPVLGRDLGRGF